jgi:hypothetical protein
MDNDQSDMPVPTQLSHPWRFDELRRNCCRTRRCHRSVLQRSTGSIPTPNPLLPPTAPLSGFGVLRRPMPAFVPFWLLPRSQP